MVVNSNFDNAIVTVTGGTGSFGATIVNYLLKNYPGIEQIRVFSRDESKQDEMRKRLDSDLLKFYLGDVRDKRSVEKVVKGSNLIFHAAALKQVPSCEFFPDQAILTNVTGSMNVFDASIKYSVEKVVGLSTDKAVYPINAMGMTKALMERVLQSFARNEDRDTKTTFALTRYGNVMLSRGSVIPLFVEQLRSKRFISITDPNMTRFLMTLDESVDLVLHAFRNANNGELYVRKAPGCTISVLAQAIAKTLNLDDYEVSVIGSRHGEKKHESLLSSEEASKAMDEQDYFRVPIDSRTLNYRPYVEEGNYEFTVEKDSYNSSNTQQLIVNEVVEKLMSIPAYIELISGGKL